MILLQLQDAMTVACISYLFCWGSSAPKASSGQLEHVSRLERQCRSQLRHGTTLARTKGSLHGRPQVIENLKPAQPEIGCIKSCVLVHARYARARWKRPPCFKGGLASREPIMKERTCFLGVSFTDSERTARFSPTHSCNGLWPSASFFSLTRGQPDCSG